MHKVAIVALLGLVAYLTLPIMTADGTNTEDHKVYVCHASSGYASLGNGYNLIHVDVASVRYEAHQAHATDSPKDNVYFGLLYDLIDVNPEDRCGAEVPPTTTTTAPPTCIQPCEPPPCVATADCEIVEIPPTWVPETTIPVEIDEAAVAVKEEPPAIVYAVTAVPKFTG